MTVGLVSGFEVTIGDRDVNFAWAFKQTRTFETLFYLAGLGAAIAVAGVTVVTSFTAGDESIAAYHLRHEIFEGRLFLAGGSAAISSRGVAIVAPFVALCDTVRTDGCDARSTGTIANETTFSTAAGSAAVTGGGISVVALLVRDDDAVTASCNACLPNLGTKPCGIGEAGITATIVWISISIIALLIRSAYPVAAYLLDALCSGHRTNKGIFDGTAHRAAIPGNKVSVIAELSSAQRLIATKGGFDAGLSGAETGPAFFNGTAVVEATTLRIGVVACFAARHHTIPTYD